MARGQRGQRATKGTYGGTYSVYYYYFCHNLVPQKKSPVGMIPPGQYFGGVNRLEPAWAIPGRFRGITLGGFLARFADFFLEAFGSFLCLGLYIGD
jgi:hypothetical protein